MPQGRRKTAFSGKKKKQQIVSKRLVKKLLPQKRNADADDSNDEDATAADAIGDTVQKINYQGTSNPNQRGKSNRYALQFHRETDKQFKALKSSAMKLIEVSQKGMEFDSQFFDGYNFPKRPPWDYAMSKEALERNENRYLTDYVTSLEKYHTEQKKPLSFFELNIETWRQLWRVIEMCDILLIITDIRTPSLMFPPSLFEYVTKELGKNVILVLNKIDLAPASVVIAWKEYFEKKYENLQVVLFTSCPSYNLRSKPQRSATGAGLNIRRKRGKMRMTVEGAQQVYNTCKKIVQSAVDLSSWDRKIADEIKANAIERESSKSDDESDEPIFEIKPDDNIDCQYENHELYRNGTLTVGCVGFPNVGKSSLLNALIGRKVVSVSRTPGHTKHFQTIFLTNNVRVCDCPGLVFPSSTPRHLQVLLGSYPIAQLRVPMASVKYLAEHMDLVRALNIHAASETQKDHWTAFDICEAWAIKRGFFTSKAARPDTSRAANNILRMALAGQIAMCFLPLDYNRDEEKWLTHESIKEVEEIQALGKVEDTLDENTNSDTESNSCANESSDDDDAHVPVVQNAFALLNTD